MPKYLIGCAPTSLNIVRADKIHIQRQDNDGYSVLRLVVDNGEDSVLELTIFMNDAKTFEIEQYEDHDSRTKEAVVGTDEGADASIPEEHPELHRPRRDEDDEIPF